MLTFKCSGAVYEHLYGRLTKIACFTKVHPKCFLCDEQKLQ